MFRNRTKKNRRGQEGKEPHCLHQIRWLTQGLIASGALNIILLAFIAYSWFGNGLLLVRDRLEPRSLFQKESESHSGRTIREVLSAFQTLSLEQLLTKLKDISPVEQGYRENDLALGYLVWKYHFNLDTALAGQLPTRKKVLPIRSGNQNSELWLYPHLTKKQFDAICRFAQSEQWPLTGEGLFQLLKQPEDKANSSLREAFCLTPEFLSIQRSFARASLAIEKEELLTLLLQGSWKKVTTESESLVQDYLARQRRRLSQMVTVAATTPKPVTVLPIAKVHVVQQGDSLWKIAKNHHIDVAKLKAYNRLSSDLLRPGFNLQIP